MSNGRVATNESQAETKHHARCRTVQNTVTNMTTSHMISTKTTITPTSLTTNETTHTTTPILTATATKAVTTSITRMRHLTQTMTKMLVNRKPQPGCQDSHQWAEQQMARPNANPTQGNGPHTNTGHTAQRPKGVCHQCANSARGNGHSQGQHIRTTVASIRVWSTNHAGHIHKTIPHRLDKQFGPFHMLGGDGICHIKVNHASC